MTDPEKPVEYHTEDLVPQPDRSYDSKTPDAEDKSYFARKFPTFAKILPASFFKSKKKEEKPYDPSVGLIAPLPQTDSPQPATGSLEQKIEPPYQPAQPVPEKSPEPDLGPYKTHFDFMQSSLAKLNVYERRIEQLEKDLGETQKQLKSSEEGLLEARGKMETYHIDYVKKESEVKTLHQRLGTLEWDLKKAKDEIAEYKRCEEAWAADKAAAKNKQEESDLIQKGLEGIVKDLENAHARQIRSMREELESKGSQITEYAHEIKSYQRKMEEQIEKTNVESNARAEAESKLRQMEELNRQVSNLLVKPQQPAQ